VPNPYEDESGVIRALVDRLGYDLEPSILIGGWATFVRVGGEISLDIDLTTSQESRHKLEQLMTDLSPSNNHQCRALRVRIRGPRDRDDEDDVRDSWDPAGCSRGPGNVDDEQDRRGVVVGFRSHEVALEASGE
jgi:hypothetical protein